MREGLVGDVLVNDVLQHGPRLAGRRAPLRPLVGDGGEAHIEFGPNHLRAEFQMLHHVAGCSRRRRHEIALFGEAAGRAVVDSTKPSSRSIRP